MVDKFMDELAGIYKVNKSEIIKEASSKPEEFEKFWTSYKVWLNDRQDNPSA